MFKCIDLKYAELLQSFVSLLNVKGRPFEQSNRPYFGMSDGNKGVQWNLVVFKDTGVVRLGVNLESSEKTGRWLITDLILSQPDIEIIKTEVRNPESIFICFSRDAWQGPARLNIKEKYLGGREYSLSEINQQIWESILKEALTCLDKNKNYRGRKKDQKVTLESNDREVIKEISPHLTVWSHITLDGNLSDNIKNKIVELQPVYDWIIRATQS